MYLRKAILQTILSSMLPGCRPRIYFLTCLISMRQVEEQESRYSLELYKENRKVTSLTIGQKAEEVLQRQGIKTFPSIEGLNYESKVQLRALATRKGYKCRAS